MNEVSSGISAIQLVYFEYCVIWLCENTCSDKVQVWCPNDTCIPHSWRLRDIQGQKCEDKTATEFSDFKNFPISRYETLCCRLHLLWDVIILWLYVIDVLCRASAEYSNSAEATWPAVPLQMWEQVSGKSDRWRQHQRAESLSYSRGDLMYLVLILNAHIFNFYSAHFCPLSCLKSNQKWNHPMQFSNSEKNLQKRIRGHVLAMNAIGETYKLQRFPRSFN